MSYTDIYDQRNSDYGSTISDSRVNNTKRVITNSFSSSPSYTEITLNNSSTPIGVQLVDDSTTKEQKILTTLESSYTFGDYIHWNNETWLTLIVDDMNFYCRGTIKRCISSLKWLDEYGEIREAYFAVSSETKGFGLDEGKFITLSSERRYIIVQKNTDTLKIKKDSRFIFDNDRCWRVSGINTLNSGLIYFDLEETQINDVLDNIELRIADYVGNVPNYTLKILNGDNISIRANQSLQINTEIRNNGTVLIDKIISYSSSNTLIATVDENGLVTTLANGVVVITATLEGELSVTDSLSVTVEFSTTTHDSVNILGKDAIFYGQSTTYDRQILSNGIVDNSKFVQWYIYGDDGVSSTDLVTATLNSTTQCTLKANTNNKSGYVRLKAVVIGNSSVYVIKRIHIKSLI